MSLLAATQQPGDAAADFLLLFAVILLGPLLMKKAKMPGIIGLLLGGYLIGPHGFDLISSGNQTVPELGQFGLLYLMFVAGLELDLGILRQYRRSAITFGFITFTAPFLAGSAVGFGLGWEPGAAILLGSLVASHTLVLYPTIKELGLGNNPAISSAVGATVLTDTIALVILAGVSSTETGSGSALMTAGSIALGLGVIVGFGLLVLPRLAAWALSLWGGDRATRYVVAVLSFLAMATIAELFGIDGIVGSFFAGLALNRLVPKAGPTMDRIEFFGGTVFIPIFLISVGLLLDPAVMFQPETLGIAALICVACIGGKALAASAARPLLGFTGPEAGAVFVLTTPQAAATLAATLIGFQIGLFGTSVVNAILVLILVSILVSSLLTARFTAKIPLPDPPAVALGAKVLMAVRPSGPSTGAAEVARRVAGPDTGIGTVFVTHTADEPLTQDLTLRLLEQEIFRGSIDGQVRRVVDQGLRECVEHAVMGDVPSIVILDTTPDHTLRWPVSDPVAAPLIQLFGTAESVGGEVQVIDPDGEEGSIGAIADRLAHRSDPTVATDLAQAFERSEPGGIVVVSLSTWTDLDDEIEVPEGVLLATVIAGRPVAAQA